MQHGKRPAVVFEFDQHVARPDRWGWPAEVRVEDPEELATDMRVRFEGVDFLTIEAWIDQWGTYYTIQSGKGSRRHVVASESGRRSFLDALIAGLVELKERTEFPMKPIGRREEGRPLYGDTLDAGQEP